MDLNFIEAVRNTPGVKLILQPPGAAMIEARVVRSIEVIIHEHICPVPDLPAIRPRPARSVKRLQERDRKARLDYCGVLDVTLIVPSLGVFEYYLPKGN